MSFPAISLTLAGASRNLEVVDQSVPYTTVRSVIVSGREFVFKIGTIVSKDNSRRHVVKISETISIADPNNLNRKIKKPRSAALVMEQTQDLDVAALQELAAAIVAFATPANVAKLANRES